VGFVRRGAAALVLVAGGAVACGPSFQAVYECDVRFEHCYAVDQGTSTVEAKKACWREWLQGYTFGQSRDRIEYAGTRLSELSLDPTLPTEEAPDAPRHRAHTASVAAPVPTNAFAPPPNMVEKAVAEAPSAGDAGITVRLPPPREECTGGCSDRWKACRESCKDGQCATCDKTYRTCVPGCFR
jgi:hypothetical protein